MRGRWRIGLSLRLRRFLADFQPVLRLKTANPGLDELAKLANIANITNCFVCQFFGVDTQVHKELTHNSFFAAKIYEMINGP